MSDYIKKTIETARKENKHSISFLARELEMPKTTLVTFFASEKGNIKTASRLIEYYNLKIVNINEY